MEDKIKAKLEGNLCSLHHLSINNTSHLHKNHAGYAPNSHFYIFVVSADFNSLNALQRHKLIYNILHIEFSEVHSISLKLLSIIEFNKTSNQ